LAKMEREFEARYPTTLIVCEKRHEARQITSLRTPLLKGEAVNLRYYYTPLLPILAPHSHLRRLLYESSNSEPGPSPKIRAIRSKALTA
jgi:hypothetical protein